MQLQKAKTKKLSGVSWAVILMIALFLEITFFSNPDPRRQAAVKTQLPNHSRQIASLQGHRPLEKVFLHSAHDLE